MVGEDLAISLVNRDCIVVFLCVKSHSDKKTQANKKTARALRTSNSSLSESYRAIQRDTHVMTAQLQSHIFKIKKALHVCIYGTFISGLKNIKLLVK